MPFKPLKIEDLRIGHYVKLECSWWRHPFAKNIFKVTTAAELRLIKKISKLTLFYDPELSDTGSEIEEKPPEGQGYSFPGSSAQVSGDQKVHLFDAERQDREEEAKEHKIRVLAEDRGKRREAYRERRNQLKKTERAYEDAAKQTKIALKNMASGDIAGLRMAENLLSDLTKSLGEDRIVMALLEVMNSKDTEDPLFVHAMNVCVLSMLVGKIMGLSGKDLTTLGLGALAHDIGYLKIPRAVCLTTAGFAREGANLKLHIEAGLSGIGRIPEFPEPGIQIIAQHHERLNGRGYPHGLTRDQISLLAKIVMIVDEYDELCNGQDDEEGLTPYEALSLMYKNATVRKTGEFDEEILILVIKTLGVYPPGTLVELNDGSIGVVISINPQCRTKPQVMIYESDVPQDEAVIVDLSQDEELSIEKSLRPQEISKVAKNYLCPNRVTGFFPSSSEISLFSQARQAVS